MKKAQTHKNTKTLKIQVSMATPNTRKLCPSLDIHYNVNLNTKCRYNMKLK